MYLHSAGQASWLKHFLLFIVSTAIYAGPVAGSAESKAELCHPLGFGFNLQGSCCLIPAFINLECLKDSGGYKLGRFGGVMGISNIDSNNYTYWDIIGACTVTFNQMKGYTPTDIAANHLELESGYDWTASEGIPFSPLFCGL